MVKHVSWADPVSLITNGNGLHAAPQAPIARHAAAASAVATHIPVLQGSSLRDVLARAGVQTLHVVPALPSPASPPSAHGRSGIPRAARGQSQQPQNSAAPAKREIGVQTDPQLAISMRSLNANITALGPSNNRQAISSRQNADVAAQFRAASRTKLPAGFQSYHFLCNGFDLPLVMEGGKKKLRAYEANDAGTAGMESAVPETQQKWLAHGKKIGSDIRALHEQEVQKRGANFPLIVLNGSSGRDADPKANNKTFIERVLLGDKIAEGMGGTCMSQDTFNNYFKTHLRNPDDPRWPPSKPVVVNGYSKEINEAIEVRDGRPTLNGLEVFLTINGRTAANVQASHPDLDPASFRRTNVTNKVGTDKGFFLLRMNAFSQTEQARNIGPALGLEASSTCRYVERGENEPFANAVERLCNEVEAFQQEEIKAGRGNVVVKASGSGNGVGIVSIPKGLTGEEIRGRVKDGIRMIEETYGSGAGFPWMAMQFYEQVVVDNHEQELRMISTFDQDENGDWYVSYEPLYFKRSQVDPDKQPGEVQINNVTSNDKKMSKEEKEDPDYLAKLVDPACSWESLEKYGLVDETNRQEALNAAKYLAEFMAFCIEKDIQPASGPARRQ